MICTENLRSAFTKDDVDGIPLQAAAGARRGRFEETRKTMPQSMEFRSLDQPWRGYCRCSCRFPARNEFRDGVCDWLLHNLAGPRSGTERQGVLYGWRSGEGAPGTDVLPQGGRGQAN